MARLYGKGAVHFMGTDHTDHHSVNGVLDLPDRLVPQALALGFTRQPPPVEAEPELEPVLVEDDTPAADELDAPAFEAATAAARGRRR
jgi:hypothetical protein